jgi:hypothetical protein
MIPMHFGISEVAYDRVPTCRENLENLEMSGRIKEVSKSQGKVREKS